MQTKATNIDSNLKEFWDHTVTYHSATMTNDEDTFPHFKTHSGVRPTADQLRLMKLTKSTEIEGKWFPSLQSFCKLKDIAYCGIKMGPLVENIVIRKASDISLKETTRLSSTATTAATANAKSGPKRQLSEGHKQLSEEEEEGALKKVASLGLSLFREGSLAAEGDEVEVPPLVPDKVLVCNGVDSLPIMNEVLGKLAQLEQTIPFNAVKQTQIVTMASCTGPLKVTLTCSRH